MIARRILTFLLFGLVLLSLAGCSATGDRGQIAGEDAPPDAIPDLSGTYSVNGLDPLGVEYGGLLVIKADAEPGHYHLQWIITGSVQEGTGVVEGNQLRVQWQSLQERGASSRGTALYTITTRGELYGERTVEGFAKAGSEQAFPNDENWGKLRIGG